MGMQDKSGKTREQGKQKAGQAREKAGQPQRGQQQPQRGQQPQQPQRGQQQPGRENLRDAEDTEQEMRERFDRDYDA
ncbi:hypothetical protein [Streptomyces sp. NPDC002671]